VPGAFAEALLKWQRDMIDRWTFADEYYDMPWPLPSDPHVSFTTKAPTSPTLLARRGGPWEHGGTVCEIHRGGRCIGYCNHGYRLRNGRLEFLRIDGTWGMCAGFGTQGLDGIEIRVPKDYSGPVPEGCRWADETLYRCRSCGRLYSDLERKSLIAGKCVCGGPSPFIKIVQTPAVAHEFDVGDRVRVAPGGRSGTVVCVVSTSVLRVRWDETGVENTLHPDVVSIVPASEDPLPRKEGVIVYEVTAEEFNEGQHPSAHHRYVSECYWSARGVGVRGGRIHWGSLRNLLSDAKSGETWIVCRE